VKIPERDANRSRCETIGEYEAEHILTEPHEEESLAPGIPDNPRSLSYVEPSMHFGSETQPGSSN
jgi:hypothetical protein